jgi:uncharacterized membrane protein
MTVLSRQQAQKRADEIHLFRQELEFLRRDGVLTLTREQDAAVQSHHQGLLADFATSFDIDRDAAARQLSTGMKIASFLGALAIAASVFFLFRQFWGRFDPPAQVVLLLIAAFGSFLATMWMHRRDPSGYFTKLVALVAFACFVLNTVMLGDIFNITPTENALIAWAALAFVLAYACDIRLLLLAGILCLAGFISAQTGTWSGMYWLDVGTWPEHYLPAAILLFTLPLWVDHRRFDGFAATWRISGQLFFFLPVLVLSNWGDGSYLRWNSDTIEGFYQLLGFAGAAAAIWLGIRRHWTDTINTGVVFFVIFLYTKFYDWWWEIMPKYLFFLVLGLTALLVLTVLRRLRSSLPQETAP